MNRLGFEDCSLIDITNVTYSACHQFNSIHAKNLILFGVIGIALTAFFIFAIYYGIHSIKNAGKI